MSRCYYIWITLFFLVQCAAIFDRRNDFEKGVGFYQKNNLDKAIRLFEKHYSEHPFSDTVLYYLHDCYRKQGDHKARILTLERLAELDIQDEQVYTTLLDHYFSRTMYDRFYYLCRSVPATIMSILDSRYTMTRNMYAILLVGATHNTAWHNDPMHYAITKGYLFPGITGAYFEHDTITIGNFIVTLDKLLEPTYPRLFYPMTHISERSFLYLPYMRLIDMEILDYQKNIDPNRPAPFSLVVPAIKEMIERGFID